MLFTERFQSYLPSFKINIMWGQRQNERMPTHLLPTSGTSFVHLARHKDVLMAYMRSFFCKLSKESCGGSSYSRTWGFSQPLSIILIFALNAFSWGHLRSVFICLVGIHDEKDVFSGHPENDSCGVTCLLYIIDFITRAWNQKNNASGRSYSSISH